jgi:hypothetical protein
MEGIAWRARAWHQTRDEVGRIGILAQYGTERCLRSLREVRRHVPVDETDRWRGPDWFPFMAIPEPTPRTIGNRTATPALVGLDFARPFDPLIFEPESLGLTKDSPAVQIDACRRTDMTRINVAKIVNHTAGVRTFHRTLNFARRPSWIGGGGSVRTFEVNTVLTTSHLRVFKAYIAHWTGGGSWAHMPHNEVSAGASRVLPPPPPPARLAMHAG